VEEVVAMGRFPHLAGLGFLAASDLAVVEASMRQTETLACRGRQLSRLSGGERQRVYLASVLAQEPRLLLLDEPTTALDIHHQARFFRLLRSLARNGITVAVVTHDLNLASFYCDRLLILSHGKSVREGTADEVLRPDVLSQVYEEPILVDRDRRTGKPFVLPVSPEAPSELGGAS
jgi:iron complex transport system ATP-binding protein